MKIVVCIKHVPARDSRLRIAPDGDWIDGVATEINESDKYALEEGLRLKEKQGGEVVAHVRPGRAEEAPKRLSRWAPTGRSTWWAPPSRPATRTTPRGRSPTREAGGPRSRAGRAPVRRHGVRRTGVMLAQMLGLPHSTLIMEVQAPERAAQGEARDGERLVRMDGAAVARGAYDPVGNQPGALRQAQGDHGRQEEGDPSAPAALRMALRRRGRTKLEGGFTPRKTPRP